MDNYTPALIGLSREEHAVPIALTPRFPIVVALSLSTVAASGLMMKTSHLAR